MLKKLLGLVRSDEKVAQALNQTSVSYSLSPDMPLIPANDAAQAKAPVEAGSDQKPKMWLDGWNERDEKRLKQPLHWEGYID
jgi:hypothetical protein